MNDTKTKSPLIITTRGSQLALWQANYVAELLHKIGQLTETLILKTTGDQIQDRPLHEIGGKGLFIKELEVALAEGQADLAVHSLKDMTARLLPPFCLAAVLERHSPRDLMIFREDVALRLNLPSGPLSAADVNGFGALTIGTGSLRRQSLLRRHAPKLTTAPVRGNVDTRLAKLRAGAWDAIILAEASLDRLGLKSDLVRALDPDWFVPCASQGALAIETMANNRATAIVAALASKQTTLAVRVERELLARLGGDCTMPFGALVQIDGNGVAKAHAIVLDTDGGKAEARSHGPLRCEEDALRLADQLTDGLRSDGAADVLERLKIEIPPSFLPR